MKWLLQSCILLACTIAPACADESIKRVVPGNLTLTITDGGPYSGEGRFRITADPSTGTPLVWLDVQSTGRGPSFDWAFDAATVSRLMVGESISRGADPFDVLALSYIDSAGRDITRTAEVEVVEGDSFQIRLTMGPPLGGDNTIPDSATLTTQGEWRSLLCTEGQTELVGSEILSSDFCSEAATAAGLLEFAQ